jgi:hypothetical protein
MAERRMFRSAGIATGSFGLQGISDVAELLTGELVANVVVWFELGLETLREQGSKGGALDQG